MFIISDWYWAGTPGVYGSARGALVADPTTDADYLAWRCDGTRNPTAWPTDEVGVQTVAMLDLVLTNGGLPPTGLATVSKADLIAYAASKRWRVETGGITLNGARIDTARDSQAMIANAYAYVTASGAASISYKANSGWVTMDAATVKAVALAVGAHVQACFAFEETVAADIEAGTLTTTAEIDALAWPV